MSYKLTQREPTPEMEKAAHRAWEKGGSYYAQHVAAWDAAPQVEAVPASAFDSFVALNESNAARILELEDRNEQLQALLAGQQPTEARCGNCERTASDPERCDWTDCPGGSEPARTAPPADDCSNLRREAGLAYPRTCMRCGLGPCRERSQTATIAASQAAYIAGHIANLISLIDDPKQQRTTVAQIIGVYLKDAYEFAAAPQPAQAQDVDALAQFIRQVDGNHALGAGVLAEKICEWLGSAQPAQAQEEMVPVSAIADLSRSGEMAERIYGLAVRVCSLMIHKHIPDDATLFQIKRLQDHLPTQYRSRLQDVIKWHETGRQNGQERTFVQSDALPSQSTAAQEQEMSRQLRQAKKDVETVLRVEGMDLEMGSRKLLKEAVSFIDAALSHTNEGAHSAGEKANG